MKIVHHYPLFHSNAPDLPQVFRVTLQMPQGAQILRAQNPDGDFDLLALQDPEEPREHRTFEYCLANVPLSDRERTYINTFRVGSDDYHFFELI